MPTSDAPLSDEERAELEALRTERAEREAQEQARKERAELARLKAERERLQRESALDARDREIRERNAKLMEPDEDLNMPVGQKVVLVSIAALAIILVLMTVFG
jgi:hypothetical protein